MQRAEYYVGIKMNLKEQLLHEIAIFKQLGIDTQIDFNKFYVYSLITHSTAIEGSTLTEEENQLLFDEDISIPNKSMTEQLMNLDLKNAYEKSFEYAHLHQDISISMLKTLSSLIKKENKLAYIKALKKSQDENDIAYFNQFMFTEHILNIREYIKNYKSSLI